MVALLHRVGSLFRFSRPLHLRIWALLIACASANAFAQDYPNRPIRFIVTFLPGGPADTVSRLIASKLTDAWRQQVVIDNRAGANGIIGSELGARAAPDGYTMLYINTSFTINTSLYPKLPYDPVKDLTPVTPMAAGPAMLVVGLSVPVRSVQELIALAKAKPGELSYGSSGNGSPSHLSVELLKREAKIDILHVPYKGAAGVVTDMFAGQIQMTMSTIAAVLPYVKANRLRALAVTSAKRWPATPDVPTIAEAAVPGYVQSNWHGIAMPAGAPSAIVAKVNAELARIARLPDVRERLDALGMAPLSMPPTEFAAFVKADIGNWAKVVKLSGAKPE
ncbi:MAG: tripartite tricarboxylate transporter substrate binding protein [Betaproteobacteria bacterium]|nr:tripartite tricarboxylate transporter substrate binding protein [Betaproteobacteria bacterium]